MREDALVRCLFHACKALQFLQPEKQQLELIVSLAAKKTSYLILCFDKKSYSSRSMIFRVHIIRVFLNVYASEPSKRVPNASKGVSNVVNFFMLGKRLVSTPH